MRFIGRIEHSFMADLVGTTRGLLNSRDSLSEKLSELDAVANLNFRRAEKLRAKLANPLLTPMKAAKIKAVVALREKAGSYLLATAKYIRAKSVDSNSFRKVPSVFTNPSWLKELEARYEAQRETVQFMEFSS